MKSIRIIPLLIILLMSTLPAQALDVLFVGNSLTFVNNLPELFRQLALAGGHEIHVNSSMPGNTALEDHAVSPITLALIAERSWDYVVLQETSWFAVIDHYTEGNFYPAARELDARIQDSQSGTAFFMTFGKEHGGLFCIDEHCSPDFPDFSSMQGWLSVVYGAIAGELDALLVPVGNVWAMALQEMPDAPLWLLDGSHPELEGSYLSACVFYAEMFGESPEGLAFTAGIDSERALFYQRIAGRVVTAAPAVDRPVALRLLPNFPNPFNPRTELRFETSDPVADVRIEIFDTAGRLVDKLDAGPLGPGLHSLPWNAGDLPSGVYGVRLLGEGNLATGKMLLLR